ncbi:hypothetical protein [Persicobacter diffluens]|uniref:Viral A-type inclusion protein n=1 Tax=Persicobacter diffluens TaxID=981 RepID=A0AAN5AIC7_9BACT|nr:hypothetical protein PEDI_08320 [Persicobacter diffluens]
MTRNLSIFTLLLFLFSCNSEEKKQKEELQSIYNEVIDIHDEAMPRMGTIVRYQSEIQKLLKDSTSSEEQHAQFRQVNVALLKSEKAMMEWMHHLNTQYDTLDYQEARQYLLEEKNNISAINKMMAEAQEEAKNIIP